MTTKTTLASLVAGPADMAATESPVFRMTITADMIASNTPVGIAPDPAEISIIDDIYAFAARLRN